MSRRVVRNDFKVVPVEERRFELEGTCSHLRLKRDNPRSIACAKLTMRDVTGCSTLDGWTSASLRPSEARAMAQVLIELADSHTGIQEDDNE